MKALRPTGKSAPKNLRLYFVPRRTFVCEKMLRDEGGTSALQQSREWGVAPFANPACFCSYSSTFSPVAHSVDEDITVSEFGLDMIALDDDVLSLCLDSAFADVEVQRDSTALFLLAQALTKLQVRICVTRKKGWRWVRHAHSRAALFSHHALQKTFGHIPRIHAKGTLSRQVVHMMAVARRQADAAAARPDDEATESRGGSGAAGEGAAFSSPGGGLVTLTVNELEGDGERSEIDIAVVLDRSLDLVSPLFTPVGAVCEGEVVAAGNSLLAHAARLRGPPRRGGRPRRCDGHG